MKKNISINIMPIAFDPIKIQTNQAPQNDHLNLSFLKDFCVVGEKMARKGHKMAIFESKIFGFYFTKLQKMEMISYFVLCCSL